MTIHFHRSFKTPTYRGLSAVSRDLMDNADKPRYVGVIGQLSTDPKLMQIFNALVQEPDLEWEFIDGSIVKAHQHSAGVPNKEAQAIGRSVAGNTTKIHMAVDALGLPIAFQLTGGEVHDAKAAPDFIKDLPIAIYTIADKGYDSRVC